MLFDWRGTLVHIPELSTLLRLSLESLGRTADPSTMRGLVDRLQTTAALPEFVDIEASIDSSSAQHHREMSLKLFERAGCDEELADALYRIEWAPENRPLYPDVANTLRAIRSRGAKVAVVSNVHFDIRPELSLHGLDELIDVYVLSFEQGFQKPDPRMFQAALDALAVEARDAVMVGDWPANDGGAVLIGVATLILPARQVLGPRGLSIVLRLID